MTRVIHRHAVLAMVLVGMSSCMAQRPGIWIESRAMSQWQASALTSRIHQGRLELWSIGDQNAREAGREDAHGGGYLYCIQPRSGRLGRPVSRIEYSRPLFHGRDSFTPEQVLRETIRGSRFTSPGERNDFDSEDAVDYEGLVFDPQNSNRLFAITEGHAPWLVQIDLSGASEPKTVSKAVRVATKEVARGDEDYPTREMKENQRWEGLVLDTAGTRFFLACERHGDDPRPRIFFIDRHSFERPKNNGAGFPRVDPKPALSQDWLTRFKQRYGKFPCISGLTYVASQTSSEPTGYLLALERNQEKLIVIDVKGRDIVKFIDLDLRAPDQSGAHGLNVHWMSPEGIAADGSGNLWLINDPVAGRNKYWPINQDHPIDAAKFQDRIPLLLRVNASQWAAPAP